jgi:exopolysaccharide (amylovoran) exporter
LKAQAASEQGVGRKVAIGFAWGITNGVVDRILAAISQLALAHFLQKRDFGLLALTYTVTTFAALLQQFGVKHALIQRPTEFANRATPAHWLSVTVGTAAAVITIVAARFAAQYYKEPSLTGLLLVSSMAFPAASAGVVAEAKLGLDMRFSFLAKLAMSGAVLSFSLGLLLAGVLHWGTYSITIPPIVVSVLRLPLVWRAAGVRIEWRPRFREWRGFLATSSTLLVASLILMCTYAGPMSLLGRLTGDAEIVGAFYFMHQLSDQPVRLMVVNLAAVMLPALSQMQENPSHQIHGFAKAVRGILLVGMPVCMAQAVVSGAVVRLVLPPKYHSSALLLSLLSFYMVGRLVFPLIENMLSAQRRQKVWLSICLAYVPSFLLVALLAIQLGPSSGSVRFGGMSLQLGPGERCALGMTACFYAVIPFALAKCFEPGGQPWNMVWRSLRFPVIGGTISVLVAASVVRLCPHTRGGDLATVACGPMIVAITYYLGCRRFAREDLNDLLSRLTGLLPQRVGALLLRLRA